MNIDSIVPIVTTSKLRETRAFYLEKLGFELSFDHEHYLGLRAGPKGTPELGFMRPDAEAPREFTGGGITLAFRVENADREHARLVKAGVEVLQPPTDRPWGARAFVIEDPNGVVIYLSHPIPASMEFQACGR